MTIRTEVVQPKAASRCRGYRDWRRNCRYVVLYRSVIARCICIAVKLIEAGITNIVIFEKSSGFGGTWRDNRYPGCRCDVPAHLYSYSFAGNPNWSRVYPGQEEILAYLTQVAGSHDLFRYTRFSSAVETATWDEVESRWKVSIRNLGAKDAEFDATYTMTADFLISAIGQLNEPYTPELPGLEGFGGKVVHSARWGSGIDLRGLRVGVVGNGATAVQIVPEIAKSSAQLTLFQRTPNWVMPRDDEEYPERTKSFLKNMPLARQIYRTILMRRGESFWGPLTQRDTDASEMLRQLCLSHMHTQLPGREDLLAKLTPPYTPGCKRILITNDFYPALLRDSVQVEVSGIKCITKNGAQMADGREINLDCIIMATGFETGNFLNTVSMSGLRSESLHSKWAREGIRALYGIGLDDMPNFGMLYGPNTNLAHNSIILMIEAQARYIQTQVKEVITARRKGQKVVMVPKSSRVKEYNDHMQKQISLTSFADSKCQSWYKTKDGTVVNNWGRNVVDYQNLLSTIQWSDYDLTGYSAEKPLRGTLSIGRVVEEKWIGSPWLCSLPPKVSSGSAFVALPRW
ncbi:cyclohexanone monooxygenase [Pyrenochaeta sp. MPI-SDFR-AT-0127]|nr:cyclohexanone monooxygenase [Pyrenochaeta sp. MPI-SDFR-AT-0127]